MLHKTIAGSILNWPRRSKTISPIDNQTLERNRMPQTIAVANQKGGVGKTSVSLHTAGALAEKGFRVLLIDMDQQANLSSVFIEQPETLQVSINDLLNEEPEYDVEEVIQKTHIENIDIIPASLHLSNLDARLAADFDFDSQFYLFTAIQEVQDQYDYVLIDCPPNLGIATRMAMVAATRVIIPVECQNWSAVGTGKIMTLIERIQDKVNDKLDILGFVINKYAANRSLEKNYRAMLREQYGDMVFNAEFRNNVEYAEAAEVHQPITHYLPKSDQANEYRNFVKEFDKRFTIQYTTGTRVPVNE